MIETVAVKAAGNRKYNKKQKQRNVCKTVPPTIETVAVTAVGNRKCNKKQENALKSNKMYAKPYRQRSKRSR